MSNASNTTPEDISNLSVSELPQAPLGPFGDIPVAYAIFRVDIDESKGVAVDTRYVYVSPEYCQITRRTAERLMGMSHMEVGEVNTAEWLSMCYRAAVEKEAVSGFEYNPLVRDWISYKLVPSDADGCCTYTFMPVTIDDERRKDLVSTADARTSLLISEMLSALSAEQDYEAAMNGVLEMLAKVIHTDRLSIFECGGPETKVSFELCAEGLPSQLGEIFGLSRDVLKKWFRATLKDPITLIPDTTILSTFSKPLYDWCKLMGVKSLMAAPFFSDGELVGFLGAYNYQLDETVDLNRLFSAVSSFIGARIDNRRLIDSLEWAGDHDVLTDLLNRRGSQLTISKLLLDNPEGPFALALLDLDDFKKINDVYGHNAGDVALRTMTKALIDSFPNSTVISRNGGDEFLLLFSEDEARNAGRLIEEFSQQELGYEYEGKRHKMTTSIGYATYPDQADNIRDLFSKADTALYSVKLAGKNGFDKYSPEAGSHLRSQLAFTPRDIMDNIPCPMLVHKAGQEDAILFVGIILAKLLGFESMYDMMRILGGSFTNLVHPDDRDRVFATLNGCTTTTKFDFRAMTKSGEPIELHANSWLVDIEEIGEVFYTQLSA